MLANVDKMQGWYDGTDAALFTGYVDPAEVPPTYIEDLKAAGFEALKAEAKKQYAAWKETKA